MILVPPRPFPGPVAVFQDRRLPETVVPAGYSALIDAYGLAVPLPRTLSAIGRRHRVVVDAGWRVMTPRHAPRPTLEGHLTFALKYEGLDLAVLKRLFLAAGPAAIAELVRGSPTGSYARRIWFLHEWLTGTRLDLPDAEAGRYVPVLDPGLQWGTEGGSAPRYRVRNNLPGTPEFCPLVFRTEALERFVGLDLPRRARDIVADVPRDILARTAASLLLKDSRSSYAIEGERPPQDRIQRWGRAIAEAGRRPLDRLGRSLRHLFGLVGRPEAKAAGFRSLTEVMDTTTPGGELIFHLMGRWRGLNARRSSRAPALGCRRRARRAGRKPKLTSEQLKHARRLFEEQARSPIKVATLFNVDRSILRQELKRGY